LNTYFNTIRLVAAASVVISHAFFLATGTSDSEPLTSVPSTHSCVYRKPHPLMVSILPRGIS